MAAERSDSILKEVVLPSLESPVRFSSLCEAHDALMEALSNNEQDLLVAAHTNQTGTTKLLVEPLDLIGVISRQADYLRALQLSCKLLVGVLEGKNPGPTVPAPPGNGSDAVDLNTSPVRNRQKILQRTIHRSQLLLDVLVKIFLASSQNADFPDSKYNILQGINAHDTLRVVPKTDGLGLYTHKHNSKDSDSDDSDSDDEILTFDRRALEQEERDLMQMANTPIPGEGEGTDQPIQELVRDEDDVHDLRAELQSEWSKEEYQECQSRRKRQRTVA